MKNLSNSTHKKQITQFKKGAEDMNRHFAKEDIQMANRQKKRCSTSFFIREIEIKITMRYHLTPVRMAKINNSGNNRCWQGCRETRTLALLVGMQPGAAALETVCRFLKKLKKRTTLQASNSTTKNLSKRYRSADA